MDKPNRKRRAQGNQGREAYNSPTNNHLANGVPGWGCDVYGDEIGTIGQKTQTETSVQKGTTREKGKVREKENGRKTGRTKGQKPSFQNQTATIR